MKKNAMQKSGMNYLDFNALCRVLKSNLDLGFEPEEAWDNTFKQFEPQFEPKTLNGHKAAAFRECGTVPAAANPPMFDGEPPVPNGPVIADTGSEPEKPRVIRKR